MVINNGGTPFKISEKKNRKNRQNIVYFEVLSTVTLYQYIKNATTNLVNNRIYKNFHEFFHENFFYALKNCH